MNNNIEKLKSNLEKEIKRIEDFLNHEDNVGRINNTIVFNKGIVQGYQNTLNEINDLQNQIWKMKYQSREKFDDNEFPIGMKQASSKEALNHLFNK
jgi:hypothetical protein